MVLARYLAKARERLDHSPDIALAFAEHGDLAGVILAEAVAGTEGTAALVGVSVHPSRRRRGVGSALMAAAGEALRARGTRLFVAELAGDPALAPALKLLLACRFTESGRVRDLYRPRVDLIILERRLSR